MLLERSICISRINGLYFSLFESKMEDLLALVKKEITLASDAREKLEIFLEKELGFFKENQAFFQIFVSENKGSKLAINYKISGSRVACEYSNLTHSLIEAAQQQGIIRKDFSSNQITGIFKSIFTSIIVGRLREKSQWPDDSKETSKFIVNIFLNGVRGEQVA